MRITGVYIPPSAEATPNMLMALTAQTDLSSEGGLSNMTHLVAGDLNPNTWKHREKDLYREWINEAGPWELPHPELPTFRTAAVLDKFRLLPGDLIADE